MTKAFAVATGLVFGGSIVAASLTASRNDVKSVFFPTPLKGRLMVLVWIVDESSEHLQSNILGDSFHYANLMHHYISVLP